MDSGWLQSVVAGCVGCFVAFAAPARADIYLYQDSAGLYLTNVPNDRKFERVLADDRPASPPASTAGSRRAAGAAGRARFARHLASAAKESGVPEALLHAVITVESNYDPDAVSPKGAVGLMQLMPATALSYGVRDARDPAANLSGGARYLRDLLQRFEGDVVKALAAYHAGPGAVIRSGLAIPPFVETRRYVWRVLELYQFDPASWH